MLRQAISTAILSLTAWLITTAAFANPSPLQVITDGRAAAKTSKMTEKGILSITQSSVNLVLYACGAIGIVLVGIGLYNQYWALDDRRDMVRSGMKPMLIVAFGSLLTIPAIIAAVFPNALF